MHHLYHGYLSDITLINDPRFSPAGILAPKGYADFAFIMHSLSWLYNEIAVNYSMYLEQFYSAVANIINRNFIPKVVLDVETLPF